MAYTRLFRIERLQPDELDLLLARGFFRMHQNIFTCTFLSNEQGMHSVVWTRRPLPGPPFRASARKRLSRIKGRFAVSVQPARLDEEREELYARYLEHVGGVRSESLHAIVFGEEAPPPPLPTSSEEARRVRDQCDRGLGGDRFDTWEVTIRDGERLVALSLFDLGRDSIESIVCAWDQAYARYGLGVGTLLTEVEWGGEQGFSWHYSGYLVPGVSAFEYKREVGALEAWEPTDEMWIPLEELDLGRLPGARIQAALERARKALSPFFDCEVVINLSYRAVHLNHHVNQYVGEPWFLRIVPRGSYRRFGGAAEGAERIVTWNPGLHGYQADLCVRSKDLSHVLHQFEVAHEQPVCTSLMLRVRTLVPNTELGNLVRQLRELEGF